MENKHLQTKVGLFVFIGLALLATLLIQFSKGTSLFRGTYELHLHAVNVGGIKPRAQVLLAGVQVGTVTEINLADDGKSVSMILKIYNDHHIYGDSQFNIEQAGFLGDQFVSVDPTTNALPFFTNNADVYCAAPFDLQQVARSAAGFIARLDGTAQKLDASITDLRAQVLNAQTLANFGIALTNMKDFTAQALGAVQDIHSLVNTNGAQVSLAVSNLNYFSGQLNQLAGNAQTVLSSNSVNIGVATKNISDISVTIKQLADDLQAGKGLAGTLLQNPALATNVQSLAANLAVTSSNLNRNGIWGILWSHKPPAQTNNAAGK